MKGIFLVIFLVQFYRIFQLSYSQSTVWLEETPVSPVSIYKLTGRFASSLFLQFSGCEGERGEGVGGSNHTS